jgi:hypothetical protein
MVGNSETLQRIEGKDQMPLNREGWQVLEGIIKCSIETDVTFLLAS